jgi:GA-binding protein transcription factor alpha
MEEFKVKFVDDSMWNITGNQLSQMTAEEFQKKVPLDPHNMLWTHIELLRKCQIFGMSQLPTVI